MMGQIIQNLKILLKLWFDMWCFMPRSHLHIKARPVRANSKIVLVKFSGMWLSGGSHSVYVAVTGSMVWLFFAKIALLLWDVFMWNCDRRICL